MPRPPSTVFEYDCLVAAADSVGTRDGTHAIPRRTYDWLEERCLGTPTEDGAHWLRLLRRDGRRAVQVQSHVGVMRAPDGHQIEVLPKIGRSLGGGAAEARKLLLDMLCCMPEFRHIKTEHAHIAAVHLPLLEVFIAEFLRAVRQVVRRGLRGAYVTREENLPVLRGKLLVATHLRQNLVRADRFYVRHDEFLVDRPENRLIRTALCQVLSMTRLAEHQRLARELEFAFADVPMSAQPEVDVGRVQLDRSMSHYADAVSWATLILREQSPLTGTGSHDAPSLLFPMEKLFEAFVAKHLARRLAPALRLRTQSRERWLVRHEGQQWFQLKPDIVIKDGTRTVLLLDTKWKELDASLANRTHKYRLNEGDLYQLRAYGETYLEGVGDMALVYPRTDRFDRPLPVFEFNDARGPLRLWALPFCLRERRLVLPHAERISGIFQGGGQTNLVA